MPQSFAHITCTSPKHFTQTDPTLGYATVYTLEQIIEFIRFDCALCNRVHSSADPAPAGAITITGPQMGLKVVLPGGDQNDSPCRCIMSKPIPKHHKKPCVCTNTPHPSVHDNAPPTAELVLTPAHYSLIQNMLWGGAAQLAREQKHRKDAINHRRLTKEQRAVNQLAAYDELIRPSPSKPMASSSKLPTDSTVTHHDLPNPFSEEDLNVLTMIPHNMIIDDTTPDITKTD
ncbi:hypothetical protein BDN71DRAFT_1502003 [Pleurotus eryngii]|uniref:Uncharacterized protein n=1 Tax=Pleurotus eryngii TaxID=5323 RepID=A0A9P6A895_PLEER|nr:hypothetical protein BDN71DRAFT_1502003 [Pleurotus eryngii]